MVIAMPNSNSEVDFVILTSINYALARVGGPVVAYSKSKTIDLTGEIQVCICGHGNIGTIEGQPAQDFADMLADPSHGCTSTLKQLILTCCYAGVRDRNKVGTSTIDIIAKRLKIKDLPIQGALGPSIKANVLGEPFRVINETVAKGKKTGREGGTIQEDMLMATGNAKLADLTTGENRKLQWAKIENKMNSGKVKDGKPYIEYKAQKYADMSEEFYKKFVKQLDKEGLLLKKNQTMAVVHWDGTQVVDGVPGNDNGTRCCCYITTATVGALGLPDDCEVLTTLRRFRDEVMLKSHSGRRDVAEYYATAPAVVATIDRLPDAPAIYRSIYGEYLAPAVAAVHEGRFSEAYAQYR